MKKIEWETPDKMKINTAHKTFNQQTNFIGPGNVYANTQASMFVRAWNDTKLWNGETVEPGCLQNHDLETYWFVFYHFNHDRQIVHGHVVTDGEHNLISFFVTGPTWKSESVIHECMQYVAKPFKTNG